MVNGQNLNACRKTLRLFAPAKVNLGLRIVGRRGDGYHELESLFWPLDLLDDLWITSSPTLEVNTFWSPEAPYPHQKLPEGSQNLVTQALALGAEKGSSYSVRIEKRIPLGGGLGGGSSDAAAILRFRQEHERGFSANSEVALRLGADVPFFLKLQPAWVTGIGEHCQTLPVDAAVVEEVCFILILFPTGRVTQEVFAEYRQAGLSFSPSRKGNFSAITREGLAQYLAQAGNDLEPLVAHRCPSIRKAIDALQQTPCRYAGLSGSGSTCFAIYFSKIDQEKSFKALSGFCRSQNCKSIRARTFKA
jgi:4-diphosphocytidyl-2-C-methyl-D-erythritol kinase